MGTMEDDGRKGKKMEEAGRSCKKMTEKKSLVMEWYAYQSIRTDLIELSRPVLNRNRNKILKSLFKIAILL